MTVGHTVAYKREFCLEINNIKRGHFIIIII